MADREQREKAIEDKHKKDTQTVENMQQDDPLEKILGVFDDDITDLSTSVRDTMDELHKQQAKNTD